MKTAVVAGFVAAACVVGLTAGSALAQDAKAGAEIYTKAGCAKCHGDSGAGDGAMGLKLKKKSGPKSSRRSWPSRKKRGSSC